MEPQPLTFTSLVYFGIWFTVPSETVPIIDTNEPETLYPFQAI